MVQGSHTDLTTWISNYVELRKEINSTPDVTHHYSDAEKAEHQAHKKSEVEITPDVSGETNEEILADSSTTDAVKGKDSIEVNPADSETTNNPQDKTVSVGIDEKNSGVSEETNEVVLADSHTIDAVKEKASIEVNPADSETTTNNDTTEGASGPTPQNKTVSVSIDEKDSADVSDTGSKQLLFCSPQPPTNEDQLLDGEMKTPSFSASTKTYAAHHKRKSRASFSTKRLTSAVARETTYMLRVKQRMDALDAIISGLQGGVLKLVDSVASYQENTEQTVIKTRETISSLIRERQPTSGKESNLIDNKPVLEMMKSHQSKIDNKLAALTERISQLEQCASQLKRVGKLELMMESLTAQLQNDQGKHCSSCNCSQNLVVLNSDIHDMKEAWSQRARESDEKLESLKQTVVHAEDTNKKMNEQILRMLQRKAPNDVRLQTSDLEQTQTTHSGSGNRVDQTNAAVPRTAVSSVRQDTVSSDPRNDHSLADVNQPSATSRPHQTAQASQSRHSNDKTRKVLLMGDSTIKAVDKRYLLSHETVSKCRAAKVSDAHYKINTDSDHVKEKVIFCVGLNDLRDGAEVSQIVQDMRELIEETLHRHPRCYIYVCSILPVNCAGVTRDKITRLNAGLENLQNLWERVFYVNTMSAFMNHDSPVTLFEKDHVHPSKRGVILLANTIRRKVEFQQKSFHEFTSKPATPSTLSYASCASANPVNKAPMMPSIMTHAMSRDERDVRAPRVRPMQDSLQYNHRPPPYRQMAVSQSEGLSRLDSVNEHARPNRDNRDNVAQRQCAPMYVPRNHPVLPPSVSYQRYHPDLIPRTVPWQGHFPYPQMIYPRELSDMFNYYV